MIAALSVGCRCEAEPEPAERQPSPQIPAPSVDAGPPPAVLFVPDAASLLAPALDIGRLPEPTVCSKEMVSVAGAFCIDRYEVSLADTQGRGVLSPYYHPSVTHTRSAYSVWQEERK